ncbi:hypothetical protein [Pareuzebyella sediminis]|uniref:hypothetical protein n=1 Tax=Pareuzebyella sediminis TaxID=2607998 RepID=UPI001E3E5835|nr:hypothetical protein [Pareuzebyella sediminis]
MINAHSFHIPVMGIGFTIDTPLKVSQFGIDSVISLVDDILLERLRKMYCAKSGETYQEITDKTEDFRAKRITAYLNLIHKLAQEKFEAFRHKNTETVKNFKGYFDMLPDSAPIKAEFEKRLLSGRDVAELLAWAKDNMRIGSIDVNIMTKVDKDNYSKKEKLPSEFNDAHAALRGFANSTLNSSMILSAGMNPRLYSYIEQFEDFYPHPDQEPKKKIVLKVSDYRSALIQGKFLAKKGLWVSEYRIESGLNCGGHAFATDGYLLGPILEQFKENREVLRSSVHEILTKALGQKNRYAPDKPMSLKISAQGGVGNTDEHHFLLDYYQIDSVGWGTPFLLVPEATTVDRDTLEKLAGAKKEDLYLSNISPLGIPFHSLRGNTKDLEKERNLINGKPGSPCPKKFVALNKDFKTKGLCTASRQYQHLKIQELQERGLSKKEYEFHFNKVTEKACTCVGLGTSALLTYGLDTKIEGEGVSVCPGPNMAYFSKPVSLKLMIDHIYGRKNIIESTDRPNMFIKELRIYIDYLKQQIADYEREPTEKHYKYLVLFQKNLIDGIAYYKKLFSAHSQKQRMTIPLEECLRVLEALPLYWEQGAGNTVS